MLKKLKNMNEILKETDYDIIKLPNGDFEKKSRN